MGLTEQSYKFPDAPRKTTRDSVTLRTVRTCYAMLCVAAIGWAPNAWLEPRDECQHPQGYEVQCYVPGTTGSNLEPGSHYSEYIHETYGFYPYITRTLQGKV